jgi:hypothetical protein
MMKLRWPFSNDKTTEQPQLTLSGANSPTGTLTYDEQSHADVPGNMPAVFRRCRDFATQSTFLKEYLRTKQAFWNYGFNITTSDSSDDTKALSDWLSKPFISKIVFSDLITQEQLFIEVNATIGEMIRKLNRDTWREFLALDTVVGQWMDDGSVPALLPPERCRYQDKLGAPIVWYTHQLGVLDMQLLDKRQVPRFMARTEILLNPSFGEHVKVLKRTVTGGGFEMPGLYSLLRTIGEIASKEEGYYARAFQMRNSARHHLLGHAIKEGPHAGKGTWFWRKDRADAVIRDWNGRRGPWDYTSNFDHDIKFPWPDVKDFDDTAWKGTNMRLRTWGGPIAQLLLNDEKISEGAFVAMRAQAAEDRQMVRDFLKTIIAGAFNPPAGLDFNLVWSDLIFLDPKQAVELLKFSAQQGAASVETVREIIGMNHREENARKLREANDPAAVKKYFPMWDMSHGIRPALGQTTLDKLPMEGGGGDSKPKPIAASKSMGGDADDGGGNKCGTGRTAPPYQVPAGDTGPVGPGVSGIVPGMPPIGTIPTPPTPILPLGEPVKVERMAAQPDGQIISGDGLMPTAIEGSAGLTKPPYQVGLSDTGPIGPGATGVIPGLPVVPTIPQPKVPVLPPEVAIRLSRKANTLDGKLTEGDQLMPKAI